MQMNAINQVAEFFRLSANAHLAADTHRSTTLWLCLRGTFAVETLDGPFVLHRRQYLTLPRDYRSRLVPGHSFLGLLVAFPHRALRDPSSSIPSHNVHDETFALHSEASKAFLSSAISLIRHGHHRSNDWSSFQAQHLMHLARIGQPEIVRWLDRTPGRTLAHRRAVLQRLLYARNMILNRPFEENSLDALAGAARYSKSHFLKAFRDVFGQTPGSLHASARINMAKSLIAQSGMSIGEIAADVGYGSRCAFSRMFKNQVGVNASDFRRSLDAVPTANASELGHCA